jgi:hypothetical protein
MSRIMPNQIKRVKIAQKEMGLTDAAYRATLRQLYGVDSCTALTPTQADGLLAHFKVKGWKPTYPEQKRRWNPKPDRTLQNPARRKDPPGSTPGLITKAQGEKIRALAMVITWRVRDGLNRICMKMIGREFPVTAEEAYTMIECLKKMRDNEIRERFHGGMSWREIRLKYNLVSGVTEDEHTRIWEYIQTPPKRRAKR